MASNSCNYGWLVFQMDNLSDIADDDRKQPLWSMTTVIASCNPPCPACILYNIHKMHSIYNVLF
jgi:hypothetical protein